MSAKEITIEDKVVEMFAMERLLDYVLETMEAIEARRQNNEEVQNQKRQHS